MRLSLERFMLPRDALLPCALPPPVAICASQNPTTGTQGLYTDAFAKISAYVFAGINGQHAIECRSHLDLIYRQGELGGPSGKASRFI